MKVGLSLALLLTSVASAARSPESQPLLPTEGADWPTYGRSSSQQHYSPLQQIHSGNVRRLGLAWSMNLGPQNSATQPIAVNGVLYFATGLSVVHAVEAASGKLLWRYDPQAATEAELNLRYGWGVRGLAWSNGKVFTGTQDGRLIAIDAGTGAVLWSVRTFDKTVAAHINGPPAVAGGKVIIGFASDSGKNRGQVTAYDIETGAQIWRFFTVPGNPADGFENEAMKKAAKTWAGEWWKFGGGGAVYNSMTYDAQTDTLFVGTGNGYPSNRRVRSADRGDNLFIASIIALQGKTGAYKWHYQETPGDSWDYDATADIALADLRVAGKTRKVLMQASKNGFFYVLDRITGELISADPFATVTWASRVDLETGRPVENPFARYSNGSVVRVWPSSTGAHNWMPMAYSPRTGLAYIPKIEMGRLYTDRRVDLKHWQAPADRTLDFAISTVLPEDVKDVKEEKVNAPNPGALVAWSPFEQKAIWTINQPTRFNGGVLATGGNLVCQGTIDSLLTCYHAATGQVLWTFAAQAPLIATPITYLVKGEQYLTVLTGLGMGTAAAAGGGGRAERYGLDARHQPRRILTFKLDGTARLPPARNEPLPLLADAGFEPATARAEAGRDTFDRLCARCHGPSAIAVIQAPDLRRSGTLLSPDAFTRIVRDGLATANGMPSFNELSDTQLAELRQYLRTEARNLRDSVGKDGSS